MALIRLGSLELIKTPFERSAKDVEDRRRVPWQPMEALASFAGAAQVTGLAGEHGLVDKDLSRGEAHNYSMEVRSDAFESAKSHFFDTSSWGEFCDVTLTLKQAWQPDHGGWLKIDDYRCRQAFRHFMNLLNRAVYGSAFRRHGKRLRVLPVLEKGEVRARALRPRECGASGRWHIHCAIELPSHFDAITLENMIRECWAKVE